ncbi:MAG: DUF1206 domain-containing protein [Hymenobacteraceae bacterium]|nr:DUF1206 domain-containing protein [Hymenobacteraceae bacterium]MDX5397402.1 DUF1206 domain-containing protein [Hymenobacteraceae bacterium]MDX5442988.1 DUF1206 domain-containing protein [Hymenobacteraceae bacterium]MDX5513480.1 DUF1206 domain-containing protein [Hymenobacteraceae bacterium]
MLREAKNTFDRNKEDWAEKYARFGIAAKGIVYCLLGILAFMAAFEIGGSSAEADKQGAFKLILEQPFGKVLVAIVALGLLGYVMWRFIQAIKDPDQKGSDAKGIGIRIGYAFSGLIYLALAYYAATLVFRDLPSGSSGGSGSGSGGGSGDSSNAFFVDKLLEQPFGQWLVGIVALGIIIKGLYQFYRAFTGKFKRKVDTSTLDHKAQEAFDKAGRIGYTSRGVVLCIIGYFFIRAAFQADPSEAKGTSSAFSFIEQSSYGSWLLGLVAIGLVGYGVFMFFKAKYRRMDPLG